MSISRSCCAGAVSSPKSANQLASPGWDQRPEPAPPLQPRAVKSHHCSQERIDRLLSSFALACFFDFALLALIVFTSSRPLWIRASPLWEGYKVPPPLPVHIPRFPIKVIVCKSFHHHSVPITLFSTEISWHCNFCFTACHLNLIISILSYLFGPPQPSSLQLFLALINAIIASSTNHMARHSCAHSQLSGRHRQPRPQRGRHR